MLTYTSTGGRCRADSTWSYDASLVADGRLEVLFRGSDESDPGQLGDCNIGAPPWQYGLTRLSPVSPGSVDLEMVRKTPDGPVAAKSPATVRGYWIVRDTGLLLRIDERDDYALDDRGLLADDPTDAGSTELGAGTLTFTSTGGAGCTAGDVMTWEQVRIEDGRLRATVADDACGRGLGAEIAMDLVPADLA